MIDIEAAFEEHFSYVYSVSYTHLTLPTSAYV